jgi:hypothetical protein
VSDDQPIGQGDPGEAAAPPRKPRGCVFWGCAALVLLVVLGVLTTCVGIYVARSKVEEYTQDHPTRFAPSPLADDERAALDRRLGAFETAAKAGDATPALTLTGDEINALIERRGDLKDRLRVSIQSDRIRSQVSVPLDAMGFAGRFLNGTATLSLSLRDGRLDVRASDIEANGKPLPEVLAKAFSEQNLAEKVMDDPKTREAFAHLERIELTGGNVVVTAKSR